LSVNAHASEAPLIGVVRVGIGATVSKVTNNVFVSVVPLPSTILTKISFGPSHPVRRGETVINDESVHVVILGSIDHVMVYKTGSFAQRRILALLLVNRCVHIYIVLGPVRVAVPEYGT